MWASRIAQLVKNLPAIQETQVWFLGQEDPVFFSFPNDSAGKWLACKAGDLGLIPWLGWSPGEGQGYPLQYPGLENSRECIVCGATKSWTLLSDFHFQIFIFPRFIALSCRFSVNILPFDTIVYKPPGLTALLSLNFSVKFSVHVKNKVLPSNKICVWLFSS